MREDLVEPADHRDPRVRRVLKEFQGSRENKALKVILDPQGPPGEPGPPGPEIRPIPPCPPQFKELWFSDMLEAFSIEFEKGETDFIIGCVSEIQLKTVPQIGKIIIP